MPLRPKGGFGLQPESDPGRLRPAFGCKFGIASEPGLDSLERGHAALTGLGWRGWGDRQLARIAAGEVWAYSSERFTVAGPARSLCSLLAFKFGAYS
jgi:hypothetical protein